MRNHTKKALVLSVLSLVLCVSMLVGTTFAWFTDSVTTGVNVIKSGTLDIDLEYSKTMADGSWKDANGATDVLNPNARWEPGYTEVVYLRITNKGDLALKYQFAMNILGNVIGKSVLGNEINLSDYLVYDIVDADAAYADRDAARAAVKDAHKLVGEIVSGEMTTKGETKTLALIVYMPETVGNEANYREVAPSINLSFNLFATQYTYESDSFDNQYDANAPFSVWDGVVPAEMPETLVVDGDTQTVHVKDAAAFAYLSTLSEKWVDLYTDGQGVTYTNYANGAGANYYYSGQWTVSLESYIDLNNKPLEPVEIMFGQGTGATAFKGNGNVIRNIDATTTTGLFANGTRASFSDLVLENVKATNGALAASVNSSVTNVTVKNAVISGADYVGGLVGKTYSSVSGCKVIDSSVTATGKEAGGLIGYAEANSKGSVIANNVVENVTVYAGNRAAGLIGQQNVKVKVYGNVIDTVTVGAADTTTYQPAAVVSSSLDPDNVYNNTVINANIATNAAAATDNASLDAAITGGANTVFLGSGEYIVPDSAKGKTLTIVGNGDTSVAVTKVGTGGENCDYGLDGSTVTFENVTITTNSSTYIGYARCNGTYNNCTFNGTYTLYGDSVFNNCTFNISGDVYNIWTWGAPNATFNGCTFNSDGKAVLLYGTANTKLTVNGCTFNDNGGLDDLKAAIEIGNDYGKSYELIVNDTVVNGYEINDKGINTGSTLWGNKNSMGTDKLNVVVDGVDVY